MELGGRGTTEHPLLSQEMTDIYWRTACIFWAKTNMDNRKVYNMNLRSPLVIQEDQDLVLKMDPCNFRWISIINSYIIYRRVIDDIFFEISKKKTDLNPRFIWQGDFCYLSNSSRKVRAIPLSGTNLNFFDVTSTLKLEMSQECSLRDILVQELSNVLHGLHFSSLWNSMLLLQRTKGSKESFSQDCSTKLSPLFWHFPISLAGYFFQV